MTGWTTSGFPEPYGSGNPCLEYRTGGAVHVFDMHGPTGLNTIVWN